MFNEYSESVSDMAIWFKRLHAALEFPYSRIVARSLSTPLQLAAIEEIRQNVFGIDTSIWKVPADVFVFGLGEPRDRSVTKVGGAPYWPADAPWPFSDGLPMTFVAQFNFSCSRDLVGKTPGDLLLIFARDAAIANGDPGCLRFEWQSLGGQRLIKAEQLPVTEWKIVNCHGIRYRSWDVEGLQGCIETLGQLGSECLRESPHFIFKWFGMKIGGLPCLSVPEEIQSIPNEYRLLCSVAHIVPLTDCGWPWANSSDVIPLESLNLDRDLLYTWDGFALYIYISDEGGLMWQIALP